MALSGEGVHHCDVCDTSWLGETPCWSCGLGGIPGYLRGAPGFSTGATDSPCAPISVGTITQTYRALCPCGEMAKWHATFVVESMADGLPPVAHPPTYRLDCKACFTRTEKAA